MATKKELLAAIKKQRKENEKKTKVGFRVYQAFIWKKNGETP